MLVMRLVLLNSVTHQFHIGTFRYKNQGKFHTMWYSALQGTLSWFPRRGNRNFILCEAVACFNRFLFWNPAPEKMDIACVIQSIIMAITKIQKICLIIQKSKLCLLVSILQPLQMDVYKLVSLLNGRRKKKQLLFIRTERCYFF